MYRPSLKSYNSNYSSSSSSINSTRSTTSSTSSTTSASSTSSSKSSRREKIKRFGYCKSCKQPNTHNDWCHPCNSSRFKKDFDKWSSGNAAIDDFIKNAQSNATNHHQVLEWIPYDRFEGFRFVARGGFASVYSAIWKQGYIIKWADEKNQWERCGDRGRKWNVALKILDNSSDLSFDFFQEIKACVECGGGFGLIRCYGISQDPKSKNYIIVLYFAHRGSLRNYLDKHYNELNWMKKIGILKQIAEGLNKIHNAGYVHRDFHSGNILQSSCTEIADLGFCGPANKLSSSQKQEVYGVLPYVAPEVLTGKGYTFKSDIYSFAIIMWDVLMCQLPFGDRAHDAVLAVDIIKGLRPSIPDDTPDAFVKLIEKCWNPDPRQRPSAYEIYQELFDWLYVENEVSLQFKSADERNVQRSISSSTYRPITESHPLAIYTSRLLRFPNLSRPIRLPSSRSNSNKVYKTEKIDYVTRAFENELVYEPESNSNTRRIDLEEISEVTFEPEIIEEEYITRQYDIDLV